MAHGGKRSGAGRPKGTGKAVHAPAPASAPDAPLTIYDSPEDYLLAVVQGKAPADAVRVGAARALLPFIKRRQRTPLAALRTPKAQQVADEMQGATDLNSRFKNRVIELAAARKKGA